MSKISAGITTLTALQNEADITGELQLRTNGTTTALTLGTDQSATFAGGINENQVALSGTSPTVNCALGNIFTLTTSGTTAFGAVSNVPTTGKAYSFALVITAGGSHTVDYSGLGTNVYFANGNAPPPPASGETDVLVFMTFNGGTTWYGSLAINAAAQI
tara:strand:+ start:3261 stop:3740 length:480 start_codon:yes stop_codon:yes gene_type:complete